MALTDEEKLKVFANDAINDAKKISDEIQGQVKQEFKQKTTEGKEKIVAHFQNYIKLETEKIKKEKSVEISQANIKSRQDYFKYGADVSTRVFERVGKKIENFVNSSDYENYLFESCKNIIEKDGKNISIVIYYRPKDEEILTVKIKNRLSELFDMSKTEFVKDEKIKIGGLCFFEREKNILINDAFDEKILRSKEMLNSMVGPQFMSVK